MRMFTPSVWLVEVDDGASTFCVMIIVLVERSPLARNRGGSFGDLGSENGFRRNAEDGASIWDYES